MQAARENPSKGWCFTDFTLNTSKWHTIFHDEQYHCTYMIFQEETCPDTDRKHLQGYMFMSNGRRLAQMKKMCPTSHFEPAKGTPLDNKRYCSKSDRGGSGLPTELGDLPIKGKRKDIDVVADMVIKGDSIADVAAAYPSTFIRMHRGIERLAALYVPRRDWVTEVWWFYGATGTGKTREAFAIAGPGLYSKPGSTPFWEGYTGQSDVLLDDFRPNQMDFAELLKVTDRYPHIVNIKGSSCNLAARRIFITSPLRPEEIFVNHSTGAQYEAIDQLLRRITPERIRQFGSPVAVVPDMFTVGSTSL